MIPARISKTDCPAVAANLTVSALPGPDMQVVQDDACGRALLAVVALVADRPGGQSGRHKKARDGDRRAKNLASSWASILCKM